jgi:hypothetical protein
MKRDFLAKLPHDMALYLISYLDATTLARCCQVSKTWKGLCDDSACVEVGFSFVPLFLTFCLCFFLHFFMHCLTVV